LPQEIIQKSGKKQQVFDEDDLLDMTPMETQNAGTNNNTNKSPQNPKKTGLEDLDIFGGPAKPQSPVKKPQPVSLLF
jgi:hypothetical protein